MNAEELTTGGMRASAHERRTFAQASLAFNLDPSKNPLFLKTFHADSLK